MNTPYKLVFLPALFFCFISSAFADTPTQIGVGYGFDFRGDAHLEQYDLFLRTPLSYSTIIYGTKIASAIEFGLGYIKESNSCGSGAVRFSIMPEVILRAHERFSFILGGGAGVMTGETHLSGHELGEPILFTFKLGVQLHLNEHWSIEEVFYHQSNGHIYTENYGLDMSQLSVTYAF